MRMSKKCLNNNSDNPLTSHRTDGGKNPWTVTKFETDLHGKQDDRDQSEPGVQTVQVRDCFRLCVVVGVEDGLQGDGGEEKGGDHHNGVRVLQLLLALVAEDPI